MVNFKKIILKDIPHQPSFTKGEIVEYLNRRSSKEEVHIPSSEERIVALEEAIADLAIMLVGGISND
jgi:hypothetical protein